MATAVLASLFVVFVTVTAITLLLDHSASASSDSATASASAIFSTDAGRMQSATQAAHAATTTASSKLHSLVGFPTTTKVAAVINPYVASLQHYEAVLSGTDVPRPVGLPSILLR